MNDPSIFQGQEPQDKKPDIQGEWAGEASPWWAKAMGYASLIMAGILVLSGFIWVMIQMWRHILGG